MYFWRIFAAVGALFGIGGVAYGVDQHKKRKREQVANRARLREIEAQLALRERQLASLEAQVENRNDQVRILLAAEVARLRNAANELRHSA